MVHITLIGGKRITYNEGTRFDFKKSDGFVRFRAKATDKAKGFCLGAIKADLIERIEWDNPCKVEWEKSE